MNPYILPIVAIAAPLLVLLALGLAAMFTGAKLDMKSGEHQHLRVNHEEVSQQQ